MPTQRRPRVLVVDDEASIRTLLQRVVGSQGYEVHLAADAEEALDALRQQTMDAILLDLHMPGRYDGEELLFLLRDRGDQVPIIVISGWVDDEIVANHPECVQAVLQKPVPNAVLLAELRRALEPVA